MSCALVASTRGRGFGTLPLSRFPLLSCCCCGQAWALPSREGAWCCDLYCMVVPYCIWYVSSLCRHCVIIDEDGVSGASPRLEEEEYHLSRKKEPYDQRNKQASPAQSPVGFHPSVTASSLVSPRHTSGQTESASSHRKYLTLPSRGWQRPQQRASQQTAART